MAHSSFLSGVCPVLALLLCVTGCASNDQDAAGSESIADFWSSKLPLPAEIRGLKLGTQYRAVRKLRESAQIAEYVGLQELVNQYHIEYRFDAGILGRFSLPIGVGNEPWAIAPLRGIDAYTFTALAKDAELVWRRIVTSWHRPAVKVTCWLYNDSIGDGILALASDGSAVALAFFTAREQGWEGGQLSPGWVSPRGYVHVRLEPKEPEKFGRKRGATVTCPGSP